MSIKLPPADSPLREYFDTAYLAKICHPDNRSNLPTVRDAMTSAQKAIAADNAIKEVQVICRKSNNDIALVQFDARDHKTLFVFGQV